MHRPKLHARHRNPGQAVHEGHYPIERVDPQWVPWTENDRAFPDGMVCGGKLETGEMSFIARAVIGDQMAAGFVVKSSGIMHAPYGCREHTQQGYELLIIENQGAVAWKRCSGGQPPEDTCCAPLEVGTNFGESMLIGRTCTPLSEGRTYQGVALRLSRFALTDNDVHRPGKIHSSHNCLYVPHSGLEYVFHEHEMLMLKGTPGSLLSICRWSILKQMRVTMHELADIGGLPLPKPMKAFLTSGKK